MLPPPHRPSSPRYHGREPPRPACRDIPKVPSGGPCFEGKPQVSVSVFEGKPPGKTSLALHTQQGAQSDYYLPCPRHSSCAPRCMLDARTPHARIVHGCPSSAPARLRTGSSARYVQLQHSCHTARLQLPFCVPIAYNDTSTAHYVLLYIESHLCMFTKPDGSVEGAARRRQALHIRILGPRANPLSFDVCTPDAAQHITIVIIWRLICIHTTRALLHPPGSMIEIIQRCNLMHAQIMLHLSLHHPYT